MPFEEEIGGALRRTGETMTPADRLRLVEGGTARGRRKVALRRTTVAGSVLALAAVVLGGGHAAGFLGDAGGADGMASVAAQGGIGESVPAAAAEPRGAVTARQMLKTFTALLPRGDLSQQTSSGSSKDRSTMPYASVVHDDGKGAAQISLSLNTIDPQGESADSMVTCPDADLVDFDDCREESLADGSRYLFVQGYVYDRNRGAKQWRATLLTREGVLIDASEFNAPAEKDAAATRKNPPLTPARMKALVTAPAWDPIAAAFLAEAGAAPEAPEKDTLPGEPSGDAMVATLTGLMPDGVTVREPSGDSGYAQALVNDGRGATFVQVNAQPGMSDLVNDFDDWTSLSDGTLVREAQEADPDQKGGDGVVGWTVDTLRPDGFRVVITALNAPGWGQDAVRAEPALTTAQLKAIALDPAWPGLSS